MSRPPLPGAMSRADALAVARASLDPQEWDAINATPEGLAMTSILADIFADQSARIHRSLSARHLRRRRSDTFPTAAGGVAAVAPLALSRTRIGVEIVLPAGTVVFDSAGGHRFALDAALDFAAGAPGPIAGTATAVVVGSSSTVLAGQVDSFEEVAGGASGDEATVEILATAQVLHREAGDRFFPTFAGLYVEFTAGANVGAIARVAAWLSDDSVALDGVTLVGEVTTATWVVREWADLGFVISQTADASQGVDAELDALAFEVGRVRQSGEGDASLLRDLLYLSDVVSVPAILRACNRVAGAVGPVLMYEFTTADVDASSAIGLVPFPGPIADLSPCDVAPDATLTTGAATPDAPPPGLSALGEELFFLLRLDGVGAGDPGGYALDSTGVSTPDDSGMGTPFAAAADVSPCDAWAFDDEVMRAAIFEIVNRIRAAGVHWQFYPRFWAAS